MIVKNGYVVVEKGDTLSAIAKSLKKSVKEMMALNPQIRSADLIYPGQKLRVSYEFPSKNGAAAKQPPAAERNIYEEVSRAIRDTPSESSSNLENASCCCMIAPWKISQEGRDYTLKVTRVQEQRSPWGDNTVQTSVPEPVTNKESGRHELHIVAPPPGEDGRVTYKKILSTHTFLRKRCNLYLSACLEDRGYTKVIKSGEAFEIDSNGDIKERLRRFRPKKSPSYIVHNACITGKDPIAELSKAEERIASLKNFKEDTLKDFITGTKEERECKEYFLECRLEIARLRRERILGEIERSSLRYDTSQVERPKYNVDIIGLFSTFFAPLAYETIILEPKGSSKCSLQPKAYICVHPRFTIEGDLSFEIGEYYSKKRDPRQRGFRKESGIKEKTSLSLQIKQGSKTLLFDVERSIKTAHSPNTIVKDPSSLFEPLASSLSKIYKVAAASKELTKRRKKIVKSTKEYGFDPGKTLLEFSATDLTLYEDKNSHEVLWRGEGTFGVALFEGANVTLDLLPYVIGLGGPIGKLIEKALAYTASASDNTDGKLELNLKIEGSAKGKLKMEFVDKETIASTGTVRGDVSFTIEGIAEGSINGFGVETGAGAGFKGASAKSSSKGTGITCSLGLMQSRQGRMPRFRGDIATGGLALYYAWYSYVKRKEDDESKGEGGKKGVFGGVSHQTKLKFTAKDSITLIEPFSFVELLKEHFKKRGEKHS